MNNSSLPPRNESKKSSLWPWVLALACFLGAAVAGAMFASSSLLDKPKETKKPAEERLLTATDKATIMIMGVDERADDVGRSDTLMLATIDPDLDKAALFSIPRDTRVKIKGHGYDKINAAFAYGGERLTKQTVEDFLGVDIDYHIIINTNSFIKIIDAIGGIDINVEKRMYYEDPWDDDGGLLIDLKPGLQHMDGKTAITYVRYRDEEGDIGRIRRQQKFMKACMEQVTTPSIITKLPSILQEVFGSVKTDLSMRQILEFIGTLKTAQKNGLKTDMVPGRPLYIEGISYWIPDISETRFALAQTLGVAVNNAMRSKFERTAREYENSIPSSAREVPSDDTSIGKATPHPGTERRSEETSIGRKPSTQDTPRNSVPETPEQREPINRRTESRPSQTMEPTPAPSASPPERTSPPPATVTESNPVNEAPAPAPTPGMTGKSR